MDSKEAEHSSTDEDSECSDENVEPASVHVRTLLHRARRPPGLSDECLARVGLCHFSLDLLRMGLHGVSHG